MKKISADEAFGMLREWAGEERRVQVVMTQAWSERATSVALLNRVLVHSEKVLVTLPDERGAEVQLTLSLGGAEWEQDAGGPLAEVAEMKPLSLVTATFPNGNRYAFGEGIDVLFSKAQRLKPE